LRPEEISMIGAEIEGPHTGAYWSVCEDVAARDTGAWREINPAATVEGAGA
jgi:hypothetical protein